DCGLAIFDRAAMPNIPAYHKEPPMEAPTDVTNAPPRDNVVLIFGVDDLNSAAAQLKERGATLLLEPTDRPDWGIHIAYLRDPEGNLIEINSSMPQTEWTEELQEEATKYATP